MRSLSNLHYHPIETYETLPVLADDKLKYSHVRHETALASHSSADLVVYLKPCIRRCTMSFWFAQGISGMVWYSSSRQRGFMFKIFRVSQPFH